MRSKAGEVFYREAQTIAEIGRSRSSTRQAESATHAREGRVPAQRGARARALFRAMQAFHPDVKLSLVCMDHNDLVAAIAERTVDFSLRYHRREAFA